MAVEAYDDEIERPCDKLADFKIFRSFPSVAAVYAPRLLAALGEKTASALRLPTKSSAIAA
jgi:hypothetical protein